MRRARLAHRDEDLLVDPLGHPVLAHEVEDGELVLRVDEALPLDEHRQQRRHHPQLLLHRQHLGVLQDRQRHPERRRHARRELEASKLPRQLAHRERHPVRLPLQPLVDLQLLEQVHHANTTAVPMLMQIVGPTKDPMLYSDNTDVAAAMQAGQIDAALFDLPTALYLAAVVLDGGVVLGQGQHRGHLGAHKGGHVNFVDRQMRNLASARDGLLDADVGEGDVDPAGEAVGRVPHGLAMTHEDEQGHGTHVDHGAVGHEASHDLKARR